MLLDDLMPKYQFSEVHSVRLSVSPERALNAMKQVTPGEMPLVRVLFAIRSLPAIVAGKRGLPTARTAPLYDQMLDFGFVVLGEEPGREVVCGVIGQMWKVGGTIAAIRDAAEFAAFARPGYAKAAMNLSVAAVDGWTELRTETRVIATDTAARRGFGRYWRVIRPGSAAIRRSWLQAAKRRAKG